MTPVVFTETAKDELAAALQFYGERSPMLAARFAAEIDRAVAQIAATPQAWPSVTPRLRRYVLRQFPYLVLFRGDERGVLVAAIAHHRRDPARWRQR